VRTGSARLSASAAERAWMMACCKLLANREFKLASPGQRRRQHPTRPDSRSDRTPRSGAAQAVTLATGLPRRSAARRAFFRAVSTTYCGGSHDLAWMSWDDSWTSTGRIAAQYVLSAHPHVAFAQVERPERPSSPLFNSLEQEWWRPPRHDRGRAVLPGASHRVGSRADLSWACR
jgi:hypothetical protein